MPDNRPALYCGCGGEAIISEDGLFYEDSGERCMSCGHPGHVNIYEYLDGEARAQWAEDDACDPGCHHDEDGLPLELK